MTNSIIHDDKTEKEVKPTVFYNKMQSLMVLCNEYWPLDVNTTGCCIFVCGSISLSIVH